MKKLLFLCALLIGSFAGFSQSAGYARYDSFYFTKTGGNAEVIIMNATRDSTGGFLVNKGGGRTEFRRVLNRLSDSTYLVGGDTLKIPKAAPGFVNPMTGQNDLIYGGTSGAATRLAAPAHAGMKLGYDGTTLVWQDTTAPSPGFVNPMTSVNDLIFGGTSGAATRLAAPSRGGQRLTYNGTTLVWQDTAVAGSSTGPPNTVRGYDISGAQANYTAGNNVVFFGNKISASNNPIVDSLLYVPQNTFFSTDSILAIGHSIVYGTGAGVPDSAFVKIFSAYYRRPVANYGIVGSGITSVVQQDNLHSGSGQHRSTIAMGGLNTLRAPVPLGQDRTYQKVIGGYAALILNQLSANNYPATGSAPVNRYGTWSTIAGTNYGAKSTNVQYTSTLNDSITYAFSDSTVGVALLGCDSSASNYYGTIANVYIDNVLVRTVRTSGQTDGVADASTPALDGHLSPMAVVLRGLPYGPHTLKLVNTQSGKRLYVDYFANLQPNRVTNPIVLMHDPYMNLTGWSLSGGYGGITRNGVIDTANAKLDSLALSFAPYRVYTGKTELYYQATGSDISGDGIHPSNSGHRELAQAAKFFTDSIHTQGRTEYTNGFLYVNGRGGREEKVLTNVNFLPTNGIKTTDSTVGLVDQFYVTPGFVGSGNAGKIGLNSPYTGTGINYAFSIYPTVSSTPNILEIGGLGNGANIGFAQSNTDYYFIGIGPGVPFVGGAGAYNDLSIGGYGNINLNPGGGLVKMLGGTIQTAAGTTSAASLNLPAGTAKTSPVTGDITNDGNRLIVYDSARVQKVAWLSDLAALAPPTNSGTPGTLSPNQTNVAHSSSPTLSTYALPTTAAEGQPFIVLGEGTGFWKITQAAGQQIVFNTSSTTVGTSGYIQSSNRYAAVVLRCIVANTTFLITTLQGSVSFN